MKTGKQFWRVIIILLISGCTIEPFNNANLTRPQESSMPTDTLPLASQTVNALSSETVEIETLTISPQPSRSKPKTATSTSLPAAVIQQQCLTILPSLPEDKQYQGMIVLDGEEMWDIQEQSHYHLDIPMFDLVTRQMRFLAQDKFYSAVTSPDGTKYAVSYMTDRQIKVFSADGNLLAVVPPGEDPWMLAKWFNNEQILLTIIKPLEGVNYEVYPRDMVILNPFTQEQQRISSDYPDFDLANNRLYWAEGGTTAYDPTVTKVVYPGSVEKNVGGYILWDRIQEKKLWTLGNGHYMATPKWSPDGTQFVVINTDSDAFSFVSRDGEIARVVSINPNEPRTPSRFFYTSELYSWSPDGRYLSFWLEKITKSTSETNSANLAIYDLVTGSITDTCILFGSFQGSLSFFQAPIWSPDGKYIVTLANWQKDGPFDTLMIDLEAGFAVEIGESLTPNGWLSGEE